MPICKSGCWGGGTNADVVTVIEKNSGYIIHLNIKNENGRIYTQQEYFDYIAQMGMKAPFYRTKQKSDERGFL